MIRHACLMTAAAVALSAFSGAAMAEVSPFTTTTLSAASNAASFDATFTIDGNKTSLTNQVFASGKAPPAYSKTTTVPSYSKKETFSLLTLNANAQTLISTAKAISTAGGGLTSSSGGSIAGLSAVFSSPLGNALSISGTNIASTASFAATKTAAPVIKATTTIGALTIDASGLGLKNKLTFAGTPKPNQILYESADKKTIVITLNKQTVTKAAGKATSVTVDAVAIHIDNYTVAGHTISGDLELDPAMAN